MRKDREQEAGQTDTHAEEQQTGQIESPTGQMEEDTKGQTEETLPPLNRYYLCAVCHIENSCCHQGVTDTVCHI